MSVLVRLVVFRDFVTRPDCVIEPGFHQKSILFTLSDLTSQFRAKVTTVPMTSSRFEVLVEVRL